MAVIRAVRVSSYVLAGCVLLVTGLSVGLLDFVPDTVAQTLAESSAIDEGLLTLILFVGVPLGLALTVFARATTRTPTELVLAAFAVPCCLTTIWALYGVYAADSGVYWGGVLSIAVGTLLALAVFTDAALKRFV